MPATFQAPVKTTASGAAVRAGSAVCLCLLGLLGSLGESPLFWVVFGGAVAVVAALGGGGDRPGGGAGGSPVAHFGFPAEFHLVNEEEGETAGIGERPQVCNDMLSGLWLVGLMFGCSCSNYQLPHFRVDAFLCRTPPDRAAEKWIYLPLRAAGVGKKDRMNAQYFGWSKKDVTGFATSAQKVCT